KLSSAEKNTTYHLRLPHGGSYKVRLSCDLRMAYKKSTAKDIGYFLARLLDAFISLLEHISFLFASEQSGFMECRYSTENIVFYFLPLTAHSTRLHSRSYGIQKASPRQIHPAFPSEGILVNSCAWA